MTVKAGVTVGAVEVVWVVAMQVAPKGAAVAAVPMVVASTVAVVMVVVT